MGNYKFMRISDMIPNAWRFYKLKDMNNKLPRNQQYKTPHPATNSSSSLDHVAISNELSEITNQPHLSDQRKSYYFTRDFHPNSPTKTDHEPPRRSSRRSTKTISAGNCSCRASLESVWAKSPTSLDQTSSSDDHDSVITEYGSDPTDTCKCGGSMQNDIVRRLPPIITKKLHEEPADLGTRRLPTKIHRTSAEFSETNAYGSTLSVKVVKEDHFLSDHDAPKRSSVVLTPPAVRRAQGVKLRTNSPRIANRPRKKNPAVRPALPKRSVSESFAVVKSSKDPRRDFRESMVEMIVENNLKGSKDLEELLACYLSLNSDEYHDLIINVFKQIWFDYVHVSMIN